MNDSNPIGSRNGGKRPIQTWQPAADPEIELVECGGLGPNHHRSGSRSWIRSVGIQPDIGCDRYALLSYFYGFHGNSLVGRCVQGTTVKSRSGRILEW